MVGQVFHVVTEFRFEVGSALLGTEKLQSAVEGVSSAADGALVSFQKLGLGVAAQFGLGAGGVLGVLGTAIKSFDKFKQSQLALANVMGTSADPFAERMLAAATSMEKMRGMANEFGLPVDDLIQMTKLIGPMLNNERTKSGQGLAGPGFSTAIDMSRSLLKSAPTLGIDPGLVAGQMQSMISGHASMSDTLFQRLVSDTQAMAPFKESGSKGFNALDGAKRVEVMRKALAQFSKDADVLAGNVNTLRGQFTILSNQLTSSVSVLRSLGEALLVPIISVLKRANSFIAKEGLQIFQQLARGIGPLIKDPERLIATLMQLRNLKGDVSAATKVVSIAGAILGAASALSFFGLKIPVVTSALGWMAAMITAIEGPIKALTIGAGFGGILNSLVMLITRILGPMILLVGIFQLFSRAIAIARINDAKRLLELSPLIAKVAATFSRIFDVFNEGFGKFAELIAPIFQVTGFLEFFIDILESLSEVTMLAMAGFQGLVFGILETLNQAKSFFTGGGFNGAAISDAFNAGMDQMIERIMGGVDSGEGSLSSNVTNIAKVEIRNEFKEQQEPDRIAFSLKDQLLKAAQNPTQKRGGSMQAATVGR